MKQRFTFQLTLLLLVSITFFSCAKEGLRGGGGTGLTPGAGGGGTTPPDGTSLISSNFNGTPIPTGRDVWFNAHFKLGGNVNVQTVITISEAYITTPTTSIPLPDAIVTFSATSSAVSYNYDQSSSTWHINVPLSDAGKNVFFDGYIYHSPGMPGGLNPVDFSAKFSSNHAGSQIDWQWSAACYDVQMQYNSLNLSVVDASGTQAGAPNGYNGHAVGGARGGGAADLTGSWSGTGHVVGGPGD